MYARGMVLERSGYGTRNYNVIFLNFLYWNLFHRIFKFSHKELLSNIPKILFLAFFWILPTFEKLCFEENRFFKREKTRKKLFSFISLDKILLSNHDHGHVTFSFKKEKFTLCKLSRKNNKTYHQLAMIMAN